MIPGRFWFGILLPERFEGLLQSARLPHRR
jgi:hypothetical protein